MCQHVLNERVICTDEAKSEVGCRPKHEISPSLADMCEFVSPLLMAPSPPSCEKEFSTHMQRILANS